MTPSVRRRTAALLVLLACLVGASVGPGTAGAQQRRVVVVGDSIILGAEGAITSSFAGRGWAVTYDAAVSRSTAAGLEAIESHRAELTDSLVVSLGANDAGSPSQFRQRVQAIMDATAGVPHVYWVTIREVRDYYGPANQIVREVAAGRPNVTVVDWHAATAGATDLTSSDGLHLNGAGAARMAQVVTDAVVAGTLPAAAPATTAAPPPPTAAPTTVAPDHGGAHHRGADDGRTHHRGADDQPRRRPTPTMPRGRNGRWRTAPSWAPTRSGPSVAGSRWWCWSSPRAASPWRCGRCSAAGRRRTATRSPAHPAVRARQRAERIAAAAGAADDDRGCASGHSAKLSVIVATLRSGA